MHGGSVSIILPCYNEGSRIAVTLGTISSWFTPPPEVVVADDGSVDDTLAHAQAYAEIHPHVRLVALPHGGKGSAIRAAIPLVSNDLVIVVDADLPFDRASVAGTVEALADADLAAGNRRHRDSRYTVPVRLFGFLYRRHLVGFTFNLFVRGLLQLPHADTQCGLKGFRREALQRLAPLLTTNGFAIDVEILLAARALGLTIVEVPVHVRYESAASTVRIVQTAVSMAGDLGRIVLRRARGCYSPRRLRGGGASSRQPAAPLSRPGPSPRPDLEE